MFPPTECWVEQHWVSHVQPDPRGGVGVHIWADQLTDQTSFHTMWGPDWFIGEGGIFNKLNRQKRQFACIYAIFIIILGMRFLLKIFPKPGFVMNSFPVWACKRTGKISIKAASVTEFYYIQAMLIQEEGQK